MKDYKDTLLMMKTDFPMRGNLGVNEHNIQKFWNENDIYHKALERNAGKEQFYLHDGPPYANGNIIYLYAYLALYFTTFVCVISTFFVIM